MSYTLILGGAGFIGLNLTLKYIKENRKVIVFGKKNENNSEFSQFKDSVVYINGTLDDFNLLESVFLGYKINLVVHLVSTLIPSSNFENFLTEHHSVIFPTLKLLELMRKYNSKKIIFVSSGGTVYGNYKDDGYYREDDILNPINYYGLSKCYIEKLIMCRSFNENIEYLILRPSNPFGKYQNIYGKQGLISILIGKSLSGEAIEIWGDGKTIRDYIPIDYLCDIIYKLSILDLKNEIINIGSGKGHSINEIIQIMNNVLENKLSPTYKESRKVDSDKVILNIDKLRSYIDVNEINLEKSIKDYYDYIKGKEK